MDTLSNTIEECHKGMRLLLNKLDDVSKRLDVLETENKELKLENAQLKERLNNNSSNSSLPPSKSFKKKKSNRGTIELTIYPGLEAFFACLTKE